MGLKPWAEPAPKGAGFKSDVRIYTDGAYSPKSGIGGWAFVVAGNNTFKVRGKGMGGSDETTNNRMELTAIIKAVEYAAKNYPVDNVIIVSDSQYAIRCAGVTLPKPGAGAFGISRASIKNIDLVSELQQALNTHRSIGFEWVKGHSTDAWNITADRLAVRAQGRFLHQRERAKHLASNERKS